MELEGQGEALRRRGLEVAAVSYDAKAVLAEFAERRRISFPLLSDPGSTAIARFGLLNPAYPPGRSGKGASFATGPSCCGHPRATARPPPANG